MDITGITEELEVAIALQDCSNDTEKAINMLIEGNMMQVILINHVYALHFKSWLLIFIGCLCNFFVHFFKTLPCFGLPLQKVLKT